MKRNKLFMMFLALFGLAVVAPLPAYADDEDIEEEFEEDEEYDDGEDSSEEYEEYEEAPAEPSANRAVLESSAAEIADADDRYAFSAGPVAVFKKMTDMERDNALMKLEIEREKLTLDLARQQAEKKKVALSLMDEEQARKRKAAEDDAFIEEERVRRESDEAKQKAELSKIQREDEMNQKILDKITSADMSDPSQVSAVAQLLAFTPGAASTMPAVVAGQVAANRGEMSFEAVVPVDQALVVKSIVGAGGNYSANIENKNSQSVMRVKKGTSIEGWTATGISKDSVVLAKDGETKVLYLVQP